MKPIAVLDVLGVLVALGAVSIVPEPASGMTMCYEYRGEHYGACRLWFDVVGVEGIPHEDLEV